MTACPGCCRWWRRWSGWLWRTTAWTTSTCPSSACQSSAPPPPRSPWETTAPPSRRTGWDTHTHTHTHIKHTHAALLMFYSNIDVDMVQLMICRGVFVLSSSSAWLKTRMTLTFRLLIWIFLKWQICVYLKFIASYFENFSDSSFLNVNIFWFLSTTTTVNWMSLVACGQNKTFEDVILVFWKQWRIFSDI